MEVLIVGGTGFVGSNLCAELAERGHDVTALARNPAEATLPEGVETAVGDVTAYESIADAFEGRDAVVNLVALSPLFKPAGGTSHEAVHLGGTGNVVKAAAEHGVGRIVQQSALGADPEGSTAYIRAKGKAEAVVRESDLDWTIVRPSVIFGEGGEFLDFTRKLTTPYVTGLPGGGRTRFQPIWVGDFVPMLADCVEPRSTNSSSGGSPGEDSVEDDEHAGGTYEIGGPEVLTLADVARLAYRSAGQSLVVLPVPMALAGVGLTLAGVLPFVPMGADQYRSLNFDNTVDENDVDAFGVRPDELRTLADYLGVDAAGEGTETPERGVPA